MTPPHIYEVTYTRWPLTGDELQEARIRVVREKALRRLLDSKVDSEQGYYVAPAYRRKP